MHSKYEPKNLDKTTRYLQWNISTVNVFIEEKTLPLFQLRCFRRVRLTSKHFATHTTILTQHNFLEINVFFYVVLTLGIKYTQIHTLNVVQGGVDGTVPRSFWYAAVFWNDFVFSRKPLIFLTRWGIFYGWWRCSRPVTSPTKVANWILPNHKKGDFLHFAWF